MAATNCEMCSYYVYDEESECYVCDMDLDEDDLVKFLQGTNAVSYTHLTLPTT